MMVWVASWRWIFPVKIDFDFGFLKLHGRLYIVILEAKEAQ